MKVLALLGSTRRNGNSEYLVNQILNGIEHTIIPLAEKHIEPIIDQRHTTEGFSPVQDDYDELIQHIFNHDVILFATPLYWYGMSGGMKDFFDRWSQYLRDERFDFKAELAKKKAYVVITGGRDAKIKGLPLVQQFNYIFDFVNMEFADYLIGAGVKPEEVKNDQLALNKAAHWNSTFRS
ncbi:MULTISPECIES: flavodoxin family protein [unclassified Bacillus (in: firmicutes)]|uniref:flavodoxin family protein n=1 Tax=unclassified Bacillus (in: firmicutes) TaxID=185979 RepID=UPI0008F15E98|nr:MULTISPECIES: flavodoxin family protein [unclassified Bacillus (in: firmicutes)]SFB11861.1 Multimeric flavodoxin WrbA [Bacillus sp. UNCCL13]SFQ90404.1 Multimeric flavodoxin WrbA [Bacillus sp. cl95]